MKVIGLLIVMAACLASPPLQAAGSTFGRVDCGKWLSDVGSPGDKNKVWLLGYINGLNQAMLKGDLADPLDDLEPGGQEDGEGRHHMDEETALARHPAAVRIAGTMELRQISETDERSAFADEHEAVQT